MTIKKGDTIQVLSGRDKGQKGTVELAAPGSDRVVVAGLNMRTHHLKPSKANPRGGLARIASPMKRSIVMVVCPHCSKPTRIKMVISDTGVKNRACQHCGDSLDTK